MNKITRRQFIATAGGALTATTLSAAFGASGASERRFNILWLMTDQHNHGVMGCAGHPVVRTPNLDRLASQGARFTHATCVTPFCSPTRASFVTGVYPHTHGIVKNLNKAEEGKGIVGDCLCTENLLRRQGYLTRFLGKWHLGRITDLDCYADQETDVPYPQAYSDFLKAAGQKAKAEGPRPGEVAASRCFMTPEMAAFHAVWKDDKHRSKQDVSIIGRSARKAEYAPESWLADRCVELIEERQDENFMVALSLGPPHALWVCPDSYYDMYDPKQVWFPPSANDHPAVYRNTQSARLGQMGEANLREYLRCYLGLVTMVDALFGRVLEALDRLGLAQNTLVLFTADHGDMQGAHGMADKSISGYYEEILRVPLLMRYPGHVPPGSVIGSAASSVDLMPTLLDFAGLPIPAGRQGHSLRSVLEGREKREFDAAYCERGLGNDKRFSRMVRTAEAKYAWFGDGRAELFALKDDPYELRNVADDRSYSALRKELHSMLIRQAGKTNDPALQPLVSAAV